MKFITIFLISFLIPITLLSAEKLAWIKNDSSSNSTLHLSSEEKIYLANKQVIKMCIDPDWMPLEKFDEQGKHVGMTADYFETFQKAIGIPIQAIQTKTWTESIEAAKARKCDIYSLAMETKERKEYMNFTTPYLSIPLVLATRLDVPFIDNIKYIKKQKIGIMEGYAFNEIIRKEYPNIEVIDIDTLKNGLQRVANGELFGVIGTLASIGYHFQTNFIGELKIAGKFNEKWELGIGVRNDEQILQGIFEKAIQNLSPQYKQTILNNYIAIKYEKRTDYKLLIQVLAIVFIIMVVGLYHYRRLSIINNKMKLLQEELKEQAHHDALTKLPNRILFNDRLSQAIESSKRNDKTFALLFIDLDHFKEINDSLGHDIGDEVLKIVSLRLQELIRSEDTVARLGGDEFTIILEELTQPEDASTIATKIIEALSKSIDVMGNTLYVSSSIGISVYPDDGTTAVNLLKYADSAMYKAKDEGRNNYQYYNPTMTELAFERVVMETCLRSALKNEEFIIYYQPQINGVTDKLIGMEALVRWQHPTMGLIPPDKFIPLAESTGLIIELDRLVMKIAMTQFSQWHKKGLNPGKLAMNLAIKQLKQKDFVEVLQTLLQLTECKSEWIELEVTEGQIMTNPEEAIKTLQKISDIGIGLAVDDFGTGYSSLAYLKKLPINKLKVDQAFVSDLPDDEEDVGITKAVIALAYSLNLKVIAEGVETKEQRDFLIENRCENIQGYFYSKPVPADELEVILRNGLNKP